jgi:hypothetical protein
MQRIPILTSIPPSLSRTDSVGTNVGETYQKACIHSWIQQGFAPISVNPTHELQLIRDRFRELKVEPVARDATALIGRPLVYLHDLLSAGIAQGDGPVALTNADIIIDAPFSLVERVARLEPRRALFGRRLEVASMSSRQGWTQLFGYDFFAIHSDDLRRLADAGFVFGAPWWDYALPTALLAAGVQPELIEEPFAFHLVHPERWSKRDWLYFGELFLQTVPPLLRAGRDESALVHAYLQRLTSTTGGTQAKLFQSLRGVLSRWAPQVSDAARRRLLNRVSAITTEFFAEALSSPC